MTPASSKKKALRELLTLLSDTKLTDPIGSKKALWRSSPTLFSPTGERERKYVGQTNTPRKLVSPTPIPLIGRPDSNSESDLSGIHNRGGAYNLYKQVYFRMAEFLRAGTVGNRASGGKRSF
nr:MAG: ORF3 [Torque teno polar bear virus 43]